MRQSSLFRVFGNAASAVKETFAPVDPRAVPVETAETRLVRDGLRPGNGRGNLATRSELERRLAEDGVQVDREALERTLRLMIQDRRIDQTSAGEFFTIDDGPAFIKASAEPPPTPVEIANHTGWAQDHGRLGGWFDVHPYYE
jgi:hypothetical protein